VSLSAAFAAVSGLLPHVLHHAGGFAGAAILAGAAGSILFGVLGLLAAIPFLLRLHRRFGSWRAPGVALAAFAMMFSASTFVIGPMISGEGGDESPASAPTGPTQSDPTGSPPASGGANEGNGHEAHH
jgi:hypothetical protein